MSREIKFRAWFRPTQKYKTWIANRYGSEPSGLELYYYTTEDFLDDTWVNTDDYEEPIVFEQYTGLKDKNGKEIYEGDIIRYKVLRDDCSARHGYKYRGVIEAVKYDNEFGMYITGPYSSLGTIANHYEPEIIGNIHENPELLGGEE